VKTHYFVSALTAGGWVALLAGSMAAQTLPVNPIIPLPPQQPIVPQAPQPLPPALPPIEPPEPPIDPDPEAVPGGTVVVRDILFRGNTVIATEELEALAAPYIGRPVTFAELVKLRDAVTLLYYDRGYITSRARLLSPQNQEFSPEGATFTLQIIEGTVQEIELSGSPRLHRYVQPRLQKAVSPVFNQNELYSALRFLQVDPLIQQLSAALVSGDRPGATILRVELQETPPLAASVFLNNNRSPAIGEWERGVSLEHLNLLGLGDNLQLTYRNTAGSHSGQGSYRIPFNSSNGTVQISYSNTASNIVEEPFNQIDITSSYRSYNLSLRQPVLRTANEDSTREFALGLTLARSESETALLDTPFPLSSGADEQGRTRILALRFFQDYTERSRFQILSARSQFNFGVDAFDATRNPTAPDGQFISWLGQAVWVKPLPRNLSFQVRSAVQLADRPLPALEQFVLGGAGTVRGYRQDGILGDNGFLGSVELGVPVVSGRFGTLRAIPFFDVGLTWPAGDPSPNSRTLASTGVGLEYALGDQFSARLDAAIPLLTLSEPERAWRGNTLSFLVNYTFR
jgi:hemolysin activation/secretion protein